MSKTKRTLTWARCPRPDCGARVYVNADHEIEDADCECGEIAYTDGEQVVILGDAAANAPTDDDRDLRSA